MPKFNILDRVIYKENIGYIHHFSEEGFEPIAWLYGLPGEEFNVPVSLTQLKKCVRNTDYQDWFNGDSGITVIGEWERNELLKACKENHIDISMADSNCYYKQLWFIHDDKLKNVQTVKEAQLISGNMTIYDLIEYIFRNERA